MPSLTLRNVAEDVLVQLRNAARAHKRSMNAQALCWLEQAGDEWGSLEDRMALMKQIQRSGAATLRRHGLATDSAKLIRRMRDARTKDRVRRAGR